MKYEDIKVGEVYKSDGYSEMKVKLKNDELKEVVVTTGTKGLGLIVMTEHHYKNWKPLTPELPDEGLVVYDYDSTIVYRTGKGTGYGFLFDGRYELVEDENSDERWSFKSFPEKWRPATEEEGKKFNELLKKECERRGLYEDTKIKTHADGSKSFNTVNYTPGFNFRNGYNINGLIFFKGKFAEPLEEDQTLTEQEQDKETAQLMLVFIRKVTDVIGLDKCIELIIESQKELITNKNKVK